MSAKGDCYDNTSMESFFATLKKDLVHRRRFKIREGAILEIVDYIETFYNASRIHSSLGDFSPLEFERQFAGTNAISAAQLVSLRNRKKTHLLPCPVSLGPSI